jgi:hypothetical protein
MSTTRYEQWWREHSAEVAEREKTRIDAGTRIDPATANVWFEYGQMVDPYGDAGLMPHDYEYSCIGRVWFAADPNERVAVEWGDLPIETADALEAKRREADAEGWLMILGAVESAS